MGGEEHSQHATSYNHETSTPVQLCPPAGYDTLAHGSAPPSQMLYVCVRWEGEKEGGRREEGNPIQQTTLSMWYKVTECATYCSRWWGHTSPQTDSRQTGLSVKTCLQVLNIVHKYTIRYIMARHSSRHFVSCRKSPLAHFSKQQKLGGRPGNKDCCGHFMWKPFSSQAYQLFTSCFCPYLGYSLNPRCPNVGQSDPVRLLLEMANFGESLATRH